MMMMMMINLLFTHTPLLEGEEREGERKTEISTFLYSVRGEKPRWEGLLLRRRRGSTIFAGRDSQMGTDDRTRG